MISVIIPAHDEATVIGRSLSALHRGIAGAEIEFIVVCNGCTDRTAEIARAHGARVRVEEIPTASKTEALNRGDSLARGFPRFYVDADVVIEGSSILDLARLLEANRVRAIAPASRMNLSGCSWPVRCFYKINAMLPASREGIGGSGIYGLSEDGRKRFSTFPAIISDDGFVKIQFLPAERMTARDHVCEVFAPRNLASLIAIKTRSHYGNLELRNRFPELWNGNRGPKNANALLEIGARPALWPALFVYLFVKACARVRSGMVYRRKGAFEWKTDRTSRA